MSPTKTGLDWFPLDTRLDDSFELIESEFGLIGFALLLKLLQRIYGGHGYYCEWNGEVAALFARKYDVTAETVESVVRRALERALFHKALFDTHGILTSHDIQKRFRAAHRYRKHPIRTEYLLSEEEDPPEQEITKTNPFLTSSGSAFPYLSPYPPPPPEADPEAIVEHYRQRVEDFRARLRQS